MLKSGVEQWNSRTAVVTTGLTSAATVSALRALSLLSHLAVEPPDALEVQHLFFSLSPRVNWFDHSFVTLFFRDNHFINILRE